MPRTSGRFQEFYLHYLAEHRHPVTRRLHFAGTAAVLILVGVAGLTGRWRLLLLLPLAGYGPAWIGHFGFEKNRPTTFRHPVHSLRGDLTMFVDMLRGRVPF